MPNATVVIGANTSLLSRGLDRARAELRRFGSGVAGSFQNTFGGIGGQLAGVLGANAMLQAGKSAVQAAADLEALELGYRAMASESENVEEALRRVKELAKLPGLGFREALQGATNLKAVGFSARESEGILKEFGNALALVGRGKAELDGVVLALSQMSAKGKVFAQEINQIAERVPQIRKVMQNIFGTADTEVIQKTGVSVQEFIRKVVAEMSKGARAATGLKNELENISDEADRLQGEIGKDLAPGYVNLLKFGQATLKFGVALKDAVKDGKDLGFTLKETFGHNDKLKNVEDGWRRATEQAAEYRKELDEQIRAAKELRNVNLGEKMVEATKEEIKMATDLIKLKQELAELDERQASEGRKIQQETADRVKKEQELRAEKAASFKALADEIRLLQLKASGKDKEAAALEREMRIAQEVARIRKEQGLGEQAALALAKQKVALEEKVEKRSRGDWRKRIQGYEKDRAQVSYGNRFRGLDAMAADKQGFFEKNQRTSALDAHFGKGGIKRKELYARGLRDKAAANAQQQAQAQRGQGKPENLDADMVRYLSQIADEIKTLTAGL